MKSILLSLDRYFCVFKWGMICDVKVYCEWKFWKVLWVYKGLYKENLLMESWWLR